MPGADVVAVAPRDQLLARHDAGGAGSGGAEVPADDEPRAAAAPPRRAPGGDADALGASSPPLDAMAAGGIYDHLGGGFARYSVDERWLVPHFEKMLYDQALLARVYLHAWQVTGRDRGSARSSTETIDYVLRDLRHARRRLLLGRGRRLRGRGGQVLRLDPRAAPRRCSATTPTPPAAWWGVDRRRQLRGRARS